MIHGIIDDQRKTLSEPRKTLQSVADWPKGDSMAGNIV